MSFPPIVVPPAEALPEPGVLALLVAFAALALWFETRSA